MLPSDSALQHNNITKQKANINTNILENEIETVVILSYLSD